jgi:hypothetical protein
MKKYTTLIINILLCFLSFYSCKKEDNEIDIQNNSFDLTYTISRLGSPVDILSSWNYIEGINGEDIEGDIYSQFWTCENKNKTSEPLLATFSGEVIYVDTNNKDNNYGNQIIIQSSCNSEFAIRYANLDEIFVNKGDEIKIGHKLGLCGFNKSEFKKGTPHFYIALYKEINKKIGSKSVIDHLINGEKILEKTVSSRFLVDDAIIKDDTCSNLIVSPPFLIDPPTESEQLMNPVNFSWQKLNECLYQIQIGNSLDGWNEENGFTTGLEIEAKNLLENKFKWNNSKENKDYWWSVRLLKNGNYSKYAIPNKFSTLKTKIIELNGNLDFGIVDVGSSESRILKIRNKGNSDLHISNIILPSVGCYGYSTGGNGSSFDIPSNQSVDVTVSFIPQSASNYNGTIVVYSNKTAGLNQINTFAHGTETNTKIINLYPSNGISFPGLGVLVGVTSVKSFNIKNTGTTALTVNSISYPHSVFETIGSSNIIVQPNEIKTVNFSFTPLSQGNYDGVITVNSNATSGNNLITISNANGI